jgi:hypothetical protein
VGPQPVGLASAAASLSSGLPPGAAPRLFLPLAKADGVQNREPSQEEAKAFFALIQNSGVTADQVRKALNECPLLIFVKIFCGYTPLHLLNDCAREHPQLLEMVTLMVEKGAPLDVADNYRSIPLNELVNYGSNHPQLLEMVTLLL